jgi:hypothetical protein
MTVTIKQATVKALPDGRMTAEDAARYLGVAKRTLATWRSQHKGPPYLKRGGIFYRLEDRQCATVIWSYHFGTRHISNSSSVRQ